MNATEFEGTVTALSPISHGDGSLGTTTVFRTAKIVKADRSGFAKVPLVAGNAVRGALRRVSAEIMWQLDPEPMPIAVFQAIQSGGALSKSQTKLKSTQVKELQDRVPHLSLFGFSGGGRIIKGRTRFRELLPVCSETAHLTGIDSDLTVWDLLEVQSFSRVDQLAGVGGRRVTGEGLEARDSGADGTDQMRYDIQMLAAGTVFWWGFSAKNLTELEQAWLHAVLRRWDVVGGRSSAGLGRIRVDGLDGECDMGPLIDWAKDLGPVREALSWID